MIYTRGSSDDFDRYARISGDSGWSWTSLQPYFKKNERWTPPNDGHNTTGQFTPSVHGFSGINAVSLAGFPTPIDGRVINATHELGGEFSFNQDMNSGNPLGVGASSDEGTFGQLSDLILNSIISLGWVQTTIKGPERSSSATSYLASDFLKRTNLHVIVNTRVSRLIQTGTEHGSPAFRSVEFQMSSGGS